MVQKLTAIRSVWRVILPLSVLAQGVVLGQESIAPARRAVAVQVESIPEIDGVLDDPAWKSASNVRFGWLNTAGTGLYVVYTETRDLPNIDHRFDPFVPPGSPMNRAFFIKFTREFRPL